MNRQRQRFETRNMERWLRNIRNKYINELKRSLDDWEIDYQEKELRNYITSYKNYNNYLQTSLVYVSIKSRILYKHINKVISVINKDNSEYIKCIFPDCTTNLDIIGFHCWIPSHYNTNKDISNNTAILVPICSNHTAKIERDKNLFNDVILNNTISFIRNNKEGIKQIV